MQSKTKQLRLLSLNTREGVCVPETYYGTITRFRNACVVSVCVFVCRGFAKAQQFKNQPVSRFVLCCRVSAHLMRRE